MSVTAEPAELMTSAELISLLEPADRLAAVAGRSDAVERLATARARVASRRLRVVVIGPPGQGAASLIQVLQPAAAEWLPGASFTGAPGRAGLDQLWMPEPGSADVVLLVVEGSHEYGPVELDALTALRAQGTALAGVLTKIDLFPQWAEVQRANRRRLTAAKLDSPAIPLLPVSAARCKHGRERGDESLTVASGVPQLLEFLRDRIPTRVDPGLRDAVLGEVRAVVDQLGVVFSRELNAVRGNGESPQDRQQRAVAELDRCQALSANWQLALSDGTSELMGQADFDLRERLREVMELAEQDIVTANPMRDWKRFDTSVRGKIEESVQASFQLAGHCAQRLAEQAAATLAGNPDGSPTGVALPRLEAENPSEALRRIKPMQQPESSGSFARVINGMRGSYGGLLIVGVLTSLAGLPLISAWSVAAGVLMGLFTFWEDRKNGKERGKAEAKLAVSKLMDDVNFRVGEVLRSQLRAVHRALRDHFTAINDQRLRDASEAVRAAVDAAQLGGGQRDAQLSALQNHLAELRQLRIRASR